jgi:hypothetical protein
MLPSIFRVAGTSEILSYHKTKRCHNAEDLDLHLHRRENLRSRMNAFMLHKTAKGQIKFWSRYRLSWIYRGFSPVSQRKYWHSNLK